MGEKQQLPTSKPTNDLELQNKLRKRYARYVLTSGTLVPGQLTTFPSSDSYLVPLLHRRQCSLTARVFVNLHHYHAIEFDRLFFVLSEYPSGYVSSKFNPMVVVSQDKPGLVMDDLELWLARDLQLVSQEPITNRVPNRCISRSCLDLPYRWSWYYRFRMMISQVEVSELSPSHQLVSIERLCLVSSFYPPLNMLYHNGAPNHKSTIMA